MHPKWTTMISLDEARKLVARKEEQFISELATLHNEITAVETENERYKTLIHEHEFGKQKSTLQRIDTGTQTYIERTRELYFPTNYMQVYQNFGTQSVLWQLLQDRLSRFPVFMNVLENYDVDVSKSYDDHSNVALTLSLTTHDVPRRLRTTFLMKEQDQLPLDELIKNRQSELFEFNDNKSFTKEMVKDKGRVNTEIFPISELKDYSKSQDDGLFAKLLSENPNKKIHRKVFQLLEKWNETSRREVWPKLLGNRLKITPELYCNLRTIAGHNFPKSIERVIVEDLKRVVRYYLKFWNPSDVRAEAVPKSAPLDVSGLSAPKEEELVNKNEPLDDAFWENVDRLRIFENLKEVLMCFQVYRGDIGYVQGMCRLSFMTFTVFKNNIETFANLCNLLFFKKPLLICYRFEIDAIDLYEKCLDDYTTKLFPQLMKKLKRQNDKILKIFVMENFFILFANYFDEGDNK
jgi:hypothetical protein